jgi:hypothetical protein
MSLETATAARFFDTVAVIALTLIIKADRIAT